MLSKISLWLGRLSVGRKLTLIYLLDLTAVIYVSGILIHEKYLAIDFARKEIVGASYTEVVRRNLMGVFLVPAGDSVSADIAAPGTPADRAAAFEALGEVRAEYDPLLNTADPSERLSNLLAADAGSRERAALLGQGRDLLTIVGNQSNLILDPDT